MVSLSFIGVEVVLCYVGEKFEGVDFTHVLWFNVVEVCVEDGFANVNCRRILLQDEFFFLFLRFVFVFSHIVRLLVGGWLSTGKLADIVSVTSSHSLSWLEPIFTEALTLLLVSRN